MVERKTKNKMVTQLNVHSFRSSAVFWDEEKKKGSYKERYLKKERSAGSTFEIMRSELGWAAAHLPV
jgi:hypothetical protein